MKKSMYVSPILENLDMEVESILCSSLDYGESGSAGIDHFSNTDINWGGDF
jgi:hypothetical protein